MTALPDEFVQEAESVAHLASPLAMGTRAIPAFRSRPHQKMISDAIVDAVMGRGPRFIAVSVPPQYGKSTITSVCTPMWWLELFSLGVVPGGMVALVSYEDSLAMSWSSTTRRFIQARPDLFATELRRDSKAKSFWETTQGGGIIAVGIGGSLVGRPISLLIIDDPTKNMDQAQSEKHRETVWNFWQQVAIGRLQPWTIVLVCCTRWREDDLIGRLISEEFEGDPNDWRYIRIPAVAEDDDPLGRAPGDPLLRPQSNQTLDEARQELVNVRKSISQYSWNTLWQQNPVDPEGTIFLEKYWRFWGGDVPEKQRYELPDEFDAILMSWDMTFKDTKDSDLVVGQAWARKGADCYLLDQVRGRWGFTETAANVSAFARRIRRDYPNALTILVEDKANGPAVIDALRSKVGGMTEFPVNNYGSKLSRAHACQPLLIGGNLYIPAPSVHPWVKEYTRELADFPTGSKDDQVDATTQALIWLQDIRIEPSSLYRPPEELIVSDALGSISRRDRHIWSPGTVRQWGPGRR